MEMTESQMPWAESVPDNRSVRIRVVVCFIGEDLEGKRLRVEKTLLGGGGSDGILTVRGRAQISQRSLP
jgi:hypothetical protein